MSRILTDAAQLQKLQSIARACRLAFVAGAEEEARRTGRILTTDELTRVIERYPGDWFRPAGARCRGPDERR